MTTPRFYLLGPPHFAHGEAPVDLPPAKAIALLAYLAQARSGQTREQLQALLWPESFAEAARKNLRNTLWAIRKVLGDDVLRAADDRLALAEDAWVDVREFEQRAGDPGTPAADASDAERAAIAAQQRALALYAGPFLDGMAFADAPDFELWMTAERERLEQIYLRGVNGLIARLRAVGDWAEVIALAQRALTRDPLQEPLHRAIMEAQARLGARPEALRQYETLRATLDRELGVEPLPETELLRAAILDGALQPIAPPLRAGASRAGDRSHGQGRAAPHLPSGADTARAPYVGRQAERAALDAERAAAAQGHPRIVLLIGEVGIGKSRLWHEWTASLPADATVLVTRCLESTQALPFAPITALFGSAGCLSSLTAPDSPVSPIWLAEVARLLPEIRVARPDLPTPAVLPREEERRRLFEAITQALLALGTGPLFLFVDDVHWADRATLDLLDYLVHRLENRPLLLVLAYRPEDAPAALIHLAAGWGREGLVRRVPLARLTTEESTALLRALGGDPALAERVQTQGAGNPYFLIELSQAGAGDVPPALAELVRARLDRLPEAARQVLQAAAVLEPDIDFATLRRTSGRGEEETLDALDALLGGGLLVEQGTHYEFAHPLVAEVVRAGLSAARRAFLHRRAAEAIVAIDSGRLPARAGRLAAHYAEAGEPAQAARYAEMAAERAFTLAAPDEAVAFYRQALALDPTPTRQTGLGRALFWIGDLGGARAAYRVALAGFEAAGDLLGAGRACLSLAETLFPAGRFDEAQQWIEKGFTYLGEAGNPASRAFAHFLLGSTQLDAGGSLAEAEAHLEEALRLAADNDVLDVMARGRFILGNLLAQRGDLESAVRSYRESITLAARAGDQYQEILGYNNAAYHSLLAGDLASAHELVDTGLALAETRALRVPLQYLYSTQGEIALAESRWADAETWFHRGQAEAQAAGNFVQAANYQANLGLAARGRGDRDGALLLLETAHEAAAKLPAPYLQTQIDLWLAELYQERGERAASEEALARAEVRLAHEQYDSLRRRAAELRMSSTAAR